MISKETEAPWTPEQGHCWGHLERVTQAADQNGGGPWNDPSFRSSPDMLSLLPAVITSEDDAEWSRFRGNKRYDYFQQRVKHGELLRTREPYLDYKQAKMNLKPSTIELLLNSDIKE